MGPSWRPLERDVMALVEEQGGVVVESILLLMYMATKRTCSIHTTRIFKQFFEDIEGQ